MDKESILSQLCQIENEYNNFVDHALQLDAANMALMRNEYRNCLEKLPIRDQVTYFFGSQIQDIRPIKYGLIGIIVIKDEPKIDLLINKLKAHGFDHIIIIDDNSSKENLLSCDFPLLVSRLSVRAGTFGLSKVLWIESICNLFFDGCWIATFDADEFLDIDTLYLKPPTLDCMVEAGFHLKLFLDTYSYPCVPFCLLDVSPVELFKSQQVLPISTYCYYFSNSAASIQEYSNSSAVKWSLGDRFRSQLHTDLRFHLFGIAESRVKISIILWEVGKNLMLHQGFHNIIDRSANVVYDIHWAMRLGIACKTLVHQKILFTHLSPPSSKKLSQYFPRTAQNISMLSERLARQGGMPTSPQAFLYNFRGTIFMPSWSFNGKIFYVDEFLLDSGAIALRGDYEFVNVSIDVFNNLLESLPCFVALQVVLINRSCQYIQLRNTI
jgi:hypothetical protein